MFGLSFLHRHRFVGPRALTLVYAISPQQEVCAVCGWSSMTPLGEMFFVKDPAKLLCDTLLLTNRALLSSKHVAIACSFMKLEGANPVSLLRGICACSRAAFLLFLGRSSYVRYTWIALLVSGEAWLGEFEFYLGMLWQPSRKEEDRLKKDCSQQQPTSQLYKCRQNVIMCFYIHSLVTFSNKVP